MSVVHVRLLRGVMLVLEQHALAFTSQQYLVAERHTGNVRVIAYQRFLDIYF